jgi:hypothetical protein
MADKNLDPASRFAAPLTSADRIRYIRQSANL